MADGYTTVPALGHKVVYTGHRHRLLTVPVAGAERQGGRTYPRCSTIARDHFNHHTGRGRGGLQHYCVTIRATIS